MCECIQAEILLLSSVYLNGITSGMEGNYLIPFSKPTSCLFIFRLHVSILTGKLTIELMRCQNFTSSISSYSIQTELHFNTCRFFMPHSAALGSLCCFCIFYYNSLIFRPSLCLYFFYVSNKQQMGVQMSKKYE